MIIDELINEEMYCLCAPDGSLQVSTLALDFPTCVAMCRLMEKAGFGQNLSAMFSKGFEIMPVKVTITQNGDENKAFQKKGIRPTQ